MERPGGASSALIAPHASDGADQDEENRAWRSESQMEMEASEGGNPNPTGSQAPQHAGRSARPIGGVCAANRHEIGKYGGAEGNRTPDLVIANDALSQLSYGPFHMGGGHLRGGGARVKRRLLDEGARRALHLPELFHPRRQVFRHMSLFDALIVYFLRPIVSFLLIMVVVRVVMSWLISFDVVHRSNRFVAVIDQLSHAITEPMLQPIRRILPNMQGMDFSPFVLGLILLFINDYVLISLTRLL